MKYVLNQVTYSAPVFGLTAALGDNSTQLATTAYVQGAGFAPIDAPSFTTNLQVGGMIRSTAHLGYPTTGVGVELYWNTSTLMAILESYDRSGLTFQPLRLYGSTINIYSGNANIFGVSGTGAAVVGTFSATAFGPVAITNTLAASVTDLSKQLALWSTYGFSITANRMNAVVPATGAICFNVNAIDIATIDATGMYYGGIEVGYRGIPMTGKNGAYTFVPADKGRGIWHNDATSRAYTVPTGLTQGDILTVANESGTATCTLVPGTGMTMYLAGTATTGTRTVAARGLASIYIGSGGTSCYVSGPGVT